MRRDLTRVQGWVIESFWKDLKVEYLKNTEYLGPFNIGFLSQFRTFFI